MSRNREEKFMAIEYLGLSEINGPLVVLEGVKNASYEEIVEFHMDDGTRKIGRIIEIYEDIPSVPSKTWITALSS